MGRDKSLQIQSVRWAATRGFPELSPQEALGSRHYVSLDASRIGTRLRAIVMGCGLV
jgi:hypothetical protein